jgi:hypothetical protein
MYREAQAFFCTSQLEHRMTDEELWRLSGVPQVLLDLAREHTTQRKLRLVACAYARNAWDLLTDERSRNAVQVAESFADSNCNLGHLNFAQDDAALVASHSLKRDPNSLGTRAERLAVAATNEDAYAAVFMGTVDVPHLYPSCVGYGSEFNNSCREQSPLLRDIFGNPFRPVTFDPAWRAADTSGIAARMYDSRDFSAMPILADALEEAGCTNPDLLLHAREPGVHIRGCWVVDLVLGKS